ncbi:hypothetical protein ACFL04_00215 [Patescibacteria group bacterium]
MENIYLFVEPDIDLGLFPKGNIVFKTVRYQVHLFGRLKVYTSEAEFRDVNDERIEKEVVADLLSPYRQFVPGDAPPRPKVTHLRDDHGFWIKVAGTIDASADDVIRFEGEDEWADDPKAPKSIGEATALNYPGILLPWDYSLSAEIVWLFDTPE